MVVQTDRKKKSMASHEEQKWLQAAREGELAKLRELHASSTAPQRLCAARSSGVSSAGHSALHWAAAGGFTEAAQFLLSCDGTNVNLINNGGSTPLHSAASNGRAALVRMLLDHGATADLKDTEGDTPFDAAAARGHADAARALPSASSHAYLRISVGPAAGELIVRLYESAAPRACANFIGLCSGFGE